MLPETYHTTVDAESFDMSAELDKLRLHYTELKSKKEQEKAIGRRSIKSTKVNGWYEEGKIKVMTLREQEKEAKQEIPLVVPDFDPSPDHICNRLYEESRDEIATIGREKRRGVEETRETSSRPKSMQHPPRENNPRKPGKRHSTPNEVVDRLYSKNTISLNLQQMARLNPNSNLTKLTTSSSHSSMSSITK
jgi:hypothetical protein